MGGLLAATAALSVLVLSGRAVSTHLIRLDTNSGSHISSGPIPVSLEFPGVAAGLALDSAGFVPGDTAATVVDLVSASSARASTLTLTTTATSSSLLDQDPVNGVQLAIDRCSVSWEALPGATRLRYRCSGRRVPVVAPRPVLVGNVPLPNLDAAAGKRHLLVSLTLPESAGNEFQGLSSTIRCAFAADGS